MATVQVSLQLSLGVLALRCNTHFIATPMKPNGRSKTEFPAAEQLFDHLHPLMAERQSTCEVRTLPSEPKGFEPLQIRPAETRQPDLYLEPKWLRCRSVCS